MPGDHETSLEDRDDSLSDANRRISLVRILEEDGELVAAEPRSRIRRTKYEVQPVRDAAQQLVSCGVTEAVVDDLEIVEVEEDHPERFAVPLMACQRMLQPVEKE